MLTRSDLKKGSPPATAARTEVVAEKTLVQNVAVAQERRLVAIELSSLQGDDAVDVRLR